jgi:hypothetical protein
MIECGAVLVEFQEWILQDFTDSNHPCSSNAATLATRISALYKEGGGFRKATQHLATRISALEKGGYPYDRMRGGTCRISGMDLSGFY